MASIEYPWTVFTTGEDPEDVLFVMGRTVYGPSIYPTIEKVMEGAGEQLAHKSRMLGLAWYSVPVKHEVWSMSAWPSYEALEEVVHAEMKWLKSLVRQTGGVPLKRHQGYRWRHWDKVPPPWKEVQELVENLERVSPRGADAFPELTAELYVDD